MHSSKTSIGVYWGGGGRHVSAKFHRAVKIGCSVTLSIRDGPVNLILCGGDPYECCQHTYPVWPSVTILIACYYNV